ncbi:hypothetical protein [Curtobacterium sp. VKM Ac-2922]|uniref:hypothetical protein n=1 Tax=Curtobacterium sp. VKM Ac-2922 TaxID=2929475 RepID=UPI001FB38A53|nr:hypothetical protein [Curtobacterium sp. VKM Ac-2922]MCJ1714385.1 hypothetical protein [Curtobacterium sp. VKM Ac-2922]
MCGVCGSAGGTRDADADGVEDTPAARKRAQLGLVAWASRLFGPEHVRIHEAPGTVRVVVVGPTGRSVVAQGVNGVLEAVELVSAGRPDWPAVDRRLRAADPRDDTDRTYRVLASAVARRTEVRT